MPILESNRGPVFFQYLICVLLLSFFCGGVTAQSGLNNIACNSWLRTTNTPDAVQIGDLDITGNKVTVEALINRVAPYMPANNYLYAGDIVSKHLDPTDCNYLLRPRHCEITTTQGWYATPEICDFKLNKTYHIAMVYDGTTLKFYRNGFLMSQVKASGTLINNNWPTRIGDKATTFQLPENMNGYINEVRIWNTARTQNEIRANMNTTLSNPASQPGLQAYYNFSSLTNRQGNAAWNGVINGSAAISQTNTSCSFIADSCEVLSTPSVDFSYNQTECSPLSIQFFPTVTGSVNWDFGDGNFSNSASPLHTFKQQGTYKVRMNVNGSGSVFIEKTIKLDVTNNDIIKTIDTIVCENTSVTLRSEKAISYCWSPSTYLSSTTVANPVAKPLADITYRLVSKSLGANLVKNGDFESGYSDFTSAYTYSSSGIPASVFYVAASPNPWHPAMPFCKDHTSGQGNMMLVNGAEIPGEVVWKQKINVAPNTSYEFSCWLEHITTVNPARLQFSINGIQIGQVFNANSVSCIWDRFFTTWNSGTNTTAEISIVNMNTVFSGNDFALDDISFAPVIYKTDSVKIAIDKPSVNAGNDTAVCANSNIQLKASGANSYSWSPSSNLSNNSIANPIATIGDTTTRYIVTGKNANGCTANDTLSVSILTAPKIGLTNDTTICGGSVQLSASGGVSYKWTPAAGLTSATISNPIANPSTTTRYKLEVTDAKGCKSQDSVQVTVLPPFNVAISKDTAVCTGTKLTLSASGGIRYQWTPSNLLSNPNLANPIATIAATTTFEVTATSANNCSIKKSVNVIALSLPSVIISKDTAICKEGVATLKVTGGTFYNWQPAPGISNQQAQTITVNPSANTTYKVDVRNAENCIATGAVTVKLLAEPSVILSPDTTLCGVASIKLSASGGVRYLWSPAASLSDPTSATPIASPQTNTTYSVRVFGNNGCIADSSVTVRVLPALVGTVSKDTTVCAGDGAGLLATGGIKYQWSPATGLNSATIPNPVARPRSQTTYRVQITNVDNCSVTKSVIVNVSALPIVRVSNDTTICRSGSFQLHASGGTSYQWSPALGLNNAAIPNPVVSPSSTSKYRVTVRDAANCENVDSVTITVRPAPVFGISQTSVSGCAGETIQLSAYGGDQYQWSPTSGLSNPNISNPVIQLQADQVYTVLISESICQESASFSVPVSVKPAPPLVVTKSNDIFCNTPTAQLAIIGNGNDYKWSPGVGLSDSTIRNPVASPLINTVYQVSAVDANGCTSAGSIEVKVIDNNNFQLYQMPNAFTPNGDGNNDCFGISKWGRTNILYFEIFNRWGQVVFKGSNSSPCWDGNFNGVKQPSNNFVYRLKVETLCGIVEKVGNVILIR